MAASKWSLGALFGGLREATCKGNWPLEAYAKRMGVCVFMGVCVGVCGKLSIKAWRQGWELP